MKVCKAVYDTQEEIINSQTQCKQQTGFEVTRVSREYASDKPKNGKTKTKEVGCQFHYKRDNVSRTYKLATQYKTYHDYIHIDKTPRQVYHTYYSSKNDAEIGIGSVKTLRKKRVKKIYLPETADAGVGSSRFLTNTRRTRLSRRNNNRSIVTKTSSKCVGGVVENKKVCVVSEKLSPMVKTKSGITSPVIPKTDMEQQTNIETGDNTINVIMCTKNIETESKDKKSDVESFKSKDSNRESNIEIVTKEISKHIAKKKKVNEFVASVVHETKSPMMNKKAIKEHFSSNSLVEHVHDLENPCLEQQSYSKIIDPMENKLEREYRKMFQTKSRKSNEGTPIPNLKSTSILRRRFDALRRSVVRKEELKNNDVYSKITSNDPSNTSRKDVSINSDPPSLEGRSFYDIKTYSPISPHGTDGSYDKINTPDDSFVHSYDVKKQTEGKPKGISEEKDSNYNQGVKGMFKLWGKKFNLEENVLGNKASSKKECDCPIPSFISKKESDMKKEGKRFSFFRRKAKDKTKNSYRANDGVTANRCEVKDGLTIKIGGVRPLAIKDPGKVKKPEDVELIHQTWLKKFLSRATESKDVVHIRWNNKTSVTSSSNTVFELMDTIYKGNGVVLKSQSEITAGASSRGKSYRSAARTPYVNQDVETWMVPQIIIYKPSLPKVIINNVKRTKRRNVGIRISHSKYYLDKAKALAHNIELVLHSNNLTRLERRYSSKYNTIDIPKGIFSDLSSDADYEGNNHSSDEEVYNIVEYETVNSGSDLKKKINTNNDVPIGDHINSNENKLKNPKELYEVESKKIETVIKNPPAHRDVLTQGSNVYISKRCDVIRVGIITQREVKEVRKPILKFQYISSEETEPSLHMTSKKCEFAESYLRDYYRHHIPLGVDVFSWCVSDSHIQCCSQTHSRSIIHNPGDGSKSCPNIYDDYQTSVKITSGNISFPSECDEPSPSFGSKLLKKLLTRKSKHSKRVLPKDSVEVFKKRKMYIGRKKTNWICRDTSLMVESSNEDKCAQDLSTNGDVEVNVKKNSKKHVILPEGICQSFNSQLKSKSVGFQSTECNDTEHTGELVSRMATRESFAMYPNLRREESQELLKLATEINGAKTSTPCHRLTPALSTTFPPDASTKSLKPNDSIKSSNSQSYKILTLQSASSQRLKNTFCTILADTNAVPKSSPQYLISPPEKRSSWNMHVILSRAKVTRSPRQASPVNSPLPSAQQCDPCKGTIEPCPQCIGGQFDFELHAKINENPDESILKQNSKINTKNSPQNCPNKSQSPNDMNKCVCIERRNIKPYPRNQLPPKVNTKNSPQMSPKTSPEKSPKKSQSPNDINECVCTKRQNIKPCSQNQLPSQANTKNNPQMSPKTSPKKSQSPNDINNCICRERQNIIPYSQNQLPSKINTENCLQMSPKTSPKKSPTKSQSPNDIKDCVCRERQNIKPYLQNQLPSKVNTKNSPPTSPKTSPKRSPKKNQSQNDINDCICTERQNSKPCSQNQVPSKVDSKASLRKAKVTTNKTRLQMQDQPKMNECPSPIRLPWCKSSPRSPVSESPSKPPKPESPSQSPRSKSPPHSPERNTPSPFKCQPCGGAASPLMACQSKAKKFQFFNSCRNKLSKIKMKDKNKIMSWDDMSTRNGVVKLNSKEKIPVRLNRKSTPSIEEIREPLKDIKVQDADGKTLYERKDYKGQEGKSESKIPSYEKCKHLGNSAAKLVEIHLKLRLKRGDNTTLINLDSDAEKEKEKRKPPQDVYVVKDEVRSNKVESGVSENDFNDININIMIKNVKPNERKITKITGTEHVTGDNFSKKISDKFHSVSTGYSESLMTEMDAINTYSIQRAVIDSTQKLPTNKLSVEIASEILTNNNLNTNSESGTRRSEVNANADITDHTTGSNEEVSEIKIAVDSKDKVKKSHENMSLSKISSSTDNQDISLYNNTTEADEILTELNSSEPNLERRRQKKKELMKKLCEKANDVKRSKDKVRMRQLKDMMKAILTSDSSDPEEIAVTKNELLKDVTYTSLKPNYFRDTDSMNNYYTVDNTLSRTDKDSKDTNIHSKSENLNSDTKITSKNCMCSKFAARLKIDDPNNACRCKKPSRRDDEILCKISTDNSHVNNKRELINVETQNSEYLCHQVTSTNSDLNRYFVTPPANIIAQIRSIPKNFKNIKVVQNKRSDGSSHNVCNRTNHVINANYKTCNTSVKSKDPSSDENKSLINLKASECLQSFEAKKAVLEIYAEKTLTDHGERLVARLPKFLHNEHSTV